MKQMPEELLKLAEKVQKYEWVKELKPTDEDLKSPQEYFFTKDYLMYRILRKNGCICGIKGIDGYGNRIHEEVELETLDQ